MKWLLHNFWIKLLAVLMALLLWLHVATERTYEIELNYRFELTGLAGDLVLASPPPGDLTVRCRGSGKRLLLLIFRELVWPVNLAPYTRGTAEIQLSVQDAPTADKEDVQFLSLVRNGQIRLEIDRYRQKTVPILLTFTYETREGFVRAGPEVLSPDSVALSGPAGALKTITAVRARPRTFSNLTGPVDATVELERPTAYNVIAGASQCRLYADVQPYAEKTFENIPVDLPRTESGDRLAVDPISVSITVGGGQRALGALISPQVQAGLETAKLNDLPSPCKVAVRLPSGFRVVRVQPDSVLVRLP